MAAPRLPKSLFLTVWFLLLAALSVSAAGPACFDSPDRYLRESFPSVQETPDLPFGSNTNPLFANRREDLRLDLYRPAGDTCARRPLVLFLYGGQFMTGSRKDEAGSCRRFARMGFVAAATDYRKGIVGVESARNFGTPAFMASQDTRAAIRFFRKNAALYGIDTNHIYVGGCSSGGVAAVTTAYLDEEGEIPSYVATEARAGGIEGLSGNPGYSSAFAGVLNLSGGLFDTTWMHTGDEPLVAVNCAGDPTKAPGDDSLRVDGTNVGYISSYGSKALTEKALRVGIPVSWLSYQRACHCPHFVGPTGVDSTLRFFGVSLRSLWARPSALPRLMPILFPGEGSKVLEGARLFTLKGQAVEPQGPARGASGGTRRAQRPLPPGLYRVVAP